MRDLTAQMLDGNAGDPPLEAVPEVSRLGMRPPGIAPLEYRADIDGLRAIAVLAVLGFHCFPDYFPGGFVGVDVFFVISGFLISSIIFKQLRDSTFTLSDFYSRRARRILPALVVMLATCLLVGWYVLLPDEFEYLGKHIASAAVFVSNFSLWNENGYFAPANSLKPLLHLWSLGIEEQFYLAWPLLLLLLWKHTSRILLTVGVLTAASFALNIALAQDDRLAADFYFPVSRFWELGLGCLLASIKWLGVDNAAAVRQERPFISTKFLRVLSARALPVLGVALILTALFSFDSHTAFPGWAALVPTIGATCVISASQDSWFRRKVLAHRVLVFVGIISYPLYLWHWPVLSFATILKSGPLDNTERAAAAILSAALAVLTYRLIERPIRSRRPMRVTAALGGTVALLGTAGVAIYIGSGFAGRFDSKVLEVTQRPTLDSLCLESFRDSDDVNYCRRTNPSPPQVVFLGDSQAQAVYEGTVSVLGANRPMMLLARGGCPPVLNVQMRGVFESDRHRRACNEVWNTFVSYIRDNRPGTVVLVGSGWRFFDEQDPAVSSPVPDDKGVPTPEAKEAAFRVGLEQLVAALQKYSSVIYVREIPVFETAPSCFLRPLRLYASNCSPVVARSELAESRSTYRESVNDVRDNHPGLLVVDPAPSLCTSKVCSQKLRSGEILYRDEMHLSPAGGRRFAQNSGLARFIANTIHSPG